MRARNSTLRAGGPLRTYKPMKATAWKKRAPKKRPGRHDAKLRNAVRGHPCYLQIPGLCRSYPDDPTVVPCHPNWLEYDKAGGLKAPDFYTVPGCHACHAELDQGRRFTRDEKKTIWERAFEAWRPVRDKEFI